MKSLICATLAALFAALPLNTPAREVAGVMLDESIVLGSPPTPLVLNGAGVRTKYRFKIYVGALYLPERVTEVARALDMDGPKRVSLHFLYKEVGCEKLVEAWREGFVNNTTEQERSALGERLQVFDALFDTVYRDDVIRLDYLPGEGTQVWLNDRLQGTIPGADFHRALLKLWLGAHPADPSLQKAMLGLAR